MPGRNGFIVSAVFHVLIVALIYFGLPDFFKAPIPEETPIAVELINIAPETRATKVTQAPPVPKAKPEEIAQADPTPPAPPKPEPPKQEPPKPEPPKPAPPKPEPPPTPPTPPPPPAPPPPPVPPPPPPEPKPPEPKPPEPKPVPKPPEPKPEPPKPEPPKPDPPKPEPPKPAPPKPETKPVPKPAPDEPDFINKVLKDLTKTKVASADPPPDKAKPAPPAPRQASSQPNAPLAAKLSTSEMDVVKQQIEACWNIPSGARDAKELIPEFRVSMNQDGTVRSTELLNRDRLADPFFQAAADSARRALQNPRCQPLKLPPDKYSEWQTFTIQFDPKDIL